MRLAREMRGQGARASMALKPATPIEPYEDLLAELDMVLIMTVEPGFGGQTFLDLCLPKIRARPRAARQARRSRPGCRSTAASRWRRSSAAPRPGPTSFVAGSAVYSADDPNAMVDSLREKAHDAAPPAPSPQG